MRCDRARELIGAHIDEELSADDRALVAAHIESCASCRELMGDIKRTSHAIAELGREPAPTVLASRIRGHLASVAEEQEPGRKRFAPWRISSSAWRQAAALAATRSASISCCFRFLAPLLRLRLAMGFAIPQCSLAWATLIFRRAVSPSSTTVPGRRRLLPATLMI